MALAAELHDRKQADFRERQGRRRFVQWANSTGDDALVGRFADLEDARERLSCDTLPDIFLACPAMQDFIGFVDGQASRNWSADYDTSVADSIFDGFVAEARTLRAMTSRAN